MRRHGTRSGVLVLLAFALATPALGDEVDQEFSGPGADASVSVDEVFPRAQTFTVSLGGTLTRIALAAARGGATLDTDVLTLDVRPTDETGAPLLDDGSALVTLAVPATELTGVIDFANLVDFDVSGAGIVVAPGEVLAIVANADVPFFGARAFALGAKIVSGEGYAGGEAWFRPSPDAWQPQPGGDGAVDLAFRTWVPEPGTAASALAALAVLATRRARFSPS